MKKYFIILAVLAFACSETKKSENKKDLPNSIGNIDDIIVVVDSSQWSKNREIGRQLRKIFTSPVLGLPRDEPVFNVRVRKATELSKISKNAKNMVFVTTLDCKSIQCSEVRTYFSQDALKKIRDNSSKFMSVRKNLFAKNQTVMFLFSSSEDTLVKKLKQYESTVFSVFEKNVISHTKNKLFSKSKSKLTKELERKHSMSINIPFGFDKARDFKHFVWYRKINGEKEQSLFIYYEEYKDKNVFKDLGAFRDDITKRFLMDGENTEVYNARQEIIDVFTKKRTFNGHYAIEGRSLWKLSDASRGGPYVCNVILDEEANIVYYVEGYVDSPGTPKKELMRELEAILATFKTKSDLKKS